MKFRTILRTLLACLTSTSIYAVGGLLPCEEALYFYEKACEGGEEREYLETASCLDLDISLDPNTYSYLGASPCPTWISWLIEIDNPFCPVHRATTIVDNAGVQKGMFVLDAGCGPGRVTIPIATKVGPEGEVMAMDIQADMLSLAEEKARKANLTNIHFLCAGLGEKTLGYNKFDRALLVTVLGEIPDQEAALQEIFDALKPSGVLSITEIIFDPDFQRRSTVLRLAQAVGFREKEMFGNCIAFTINLEKPKNLSY